MTRTRLLAFSHDAVMPMIVDKIWQVRNVTTRRFTGVGACLAFGINVSKYKDMSF